MYSRPSRLSTSVNTIQIKNMKVKSAAILVVIGQSVNYGAAFSTLSNQISLGPRAVVPTSAGMKLIRNPGSTNRVTRSKLHMNQSTDVVAPPPEEKSATGDELFEGFGKGIARDYKARLPLYKSDITDGLNVQVSICFDMDYWGCDMLDFFNLSCNIIGLSHNLFSSHCSVLQQLSFYSLPA